LAEAYDSKKKQKKNKKKTPSIRVDFAYAKYNNSDNIKVERQSTYNGDLGIAVMSLSSSILRLLASNDVRPPS